MKKFIILCAMFNLSLFAQDKKTMSRKEEAESLKKLQETVDEINADLVKKNATDKDIIEKLNAIDKKIQVLESNDTEIKERIQQLKGESTQTVGHFEPPKSVPLSKFALPWAWESKPGDFNLKQTITVGMVLAYTLYSYDSYQQKLSSYNDDKTGVVILYPGNYSQMQGLTAFNYMHYGDQRNQVESAKHQYQTTSLLFLGAWVGFAIWNKRQYYPNQDWSWTFNMRPERNPFDLKAFGTAYDFGYTIRF